MQLGQPKHKSTVNSYGVIQLQTNKVMKMDTSQLARAAHLHDVEALEQMNAELIRERMVLSGFMTKFLDKFERKMNPDKVDTPVWDLYHAKMREYNRIDGLIKCAQYYLEHM